MKYMLFIFANLMIFSATLSEADSIKMSCRANSDLFKYEDNALFNDNAFFRKEGKWEEICSAWSHWSNTKQIIQTLHSNDNPQIVIKVSLMQ